MTSALQIVTVGGGKGGVGKSVLCTNMALTMALSGSKVVLVDTDFGASNLHALLGITNPRFGFQDYFHGDSAAPENLLLDTGIDNLKFISGSGDLPGSADLAPAELEKINSVVKNLKSDMAFLDLPPGNGLATLDWFNLGHHNLVVTTPEMTSAMNTLGFLKAALYRRLQHEFADQPEIQKQLDYSQHPGTGEEIFQINRLRVKVLEHDKKCLTRLNDVVHNFRPCLIVNRVRRKKDILMGDNVVQLARKYLEVDVRYLGYVIESDNVQDSVDEMIPFLIKDPQSKPSANVQQVVGALTNMDIHLVKKDGVIFVSKQIKLTAGWGS
ncbi:MAG: MinD/ParA family protein [Nitrospinaceae bacterium]